MFHSLVEWQWQGDQERCDYDDKFPPGEDGGLRVRAGHEQDDLGHGVTNDDVVARHGWKNIVIFINYDPNFMQCM